MPQFRTTRRVRHSAGDMFDLVADMESYPEFVPLCQSMRVRRRAPSGEGIETAIAEMTVAYKVIHETFTTRVTLEWSLPPGFVAADIAWPVPRKIPVSSLANLAC